jgi:signal transduction histidine kinase
MWLAPRSPSRSDRRPLWRFLAEASELLDGSLEYQQTLANVVSLAVPRIADYSVIALLTEDGSLGWGCSAHRDPAKAPLVARLHSYVPDLAAHNHPWAEAVRSGRTQAIKVVDDEYLRSIARNEDHLGLLRELEPMSYIVIPLAARGSILGSLMFATASDSGRRYTDRDVAIAKEVGRRISFVLDNAILYRAAQQAARSREETVAVVSHDLKNPLATIQMAVSFLRDEIVPVDEAHSLERKQLDVIQRSAERMHRLIHDLLDTAAIEAGQFQLTVADDRLRAADRCYRVAPTVGREACRALRRYPTRPPLGPR